MKRAKELSIVLLFFLLCMLIAKAYTLQKPKYNIEIVNGQVVINGIPTGIEHERLK